MIVRDGEGATHIVDFVVRGTDDDASAEQIARSVAESVLVKTALAGADPNWGRIVCAIGNSGVDIEMKAVEISINGKPIVRGSELISDEARRRARKLMKAEAFTIEIDVGHGPGEATVVTSDLTEAYVHFNSAYTS